MKKLFPFVFLLIGVGAGAGAGIFLRPETVANATDTSDSEVGENDGDKHAGEHAAETTDSHGDAKAGDTPNSNEYAKLNNQFVVPIVVGKEVTALVVLALSIEVPAGKTDAIYIREPKLRDSFLQVLFDHANAGGFEGNFTDALALGRLRTALKEIAQRDVGADLIKDVLIVEIARQDY